MAGMKYHVFEADKNIEESVQKEMLEDIQHFNEDYRKNMLRKWGSASERLRTKYKIPTRVTESVTGKLGEFSEMDFISDVIFKENRVFIQVMGQYIGTLSGGFFNRDMPDFVVRSILKRAVKKDFKEAGLKLIKDYSVDDVN